MNVYEDHGYCSLHPTIDHPAKCKKCFDGWPISFKTGYTRPMCKRRNWVGKVDHNRTNGYRLPPPEFHDSVVEIQKITE